MPCFCFRLPLDDPNKQRASSMINNHPPDRVGTRLYEDSWRGQEVEQSNLLYLEGKLNDNNKQQVQSFQFYISI